MALSPAQIEWLTRLLGKAPDPAGIQVPIHQAGAVLDALDTSPGAPGEPTFDGSETGGIRATGPVVRVPLNADATPHQVLEIGAGGAATDLGIPPDPDLVQVTRTDYRRPGITEYDATQPPPAELQGRFGTVIGNNPRGYQPNVAEIGRTLQPGGRMIFQGKTEVTPGERGINPDFRDFMDDVAPRAGTGEVPPGYRVVPEMPATPEGPPVEPLRIPTVRGPATMANKPADIMGGPFNRTTGEPVGWPNARVVIEKGLSPVTPEPATFPVEPAPAVAR